MVTFGSDCRVMFKPLVEYGYERKQRENGLKLCPTVRVLFQTTCIFNGTFKGQVQISTVEYG